MYEFTGKVQNLAIDFKSGKPVLTLEINEKNAVGHCFDELRNVEKIAVKIDKWRAKRSLDANAYCWVLIDKLAEKLNTTKEDIYRNAIRDIGGNNEIVCVQNKAVEKLCKGWNKNGIGWQTETFPSKINGCTNVILYYGSSTYDTAQMSRLIEYIIEECKAQGIDTKTPAEIAAILELWGQAK
jgi:hypothetical protein